MKELIIRRYELELQIASEDAHVRGLDGVSMPSAQHATKANLRLSGCLPSEIQTVTVTETSQKAVLAAVDSCGHAMLQELDTLGNSAGKKLTLSPGHSAM